MKIRRVYTDGQKSMLRKDLAMRTGSLLLCRNTHGRIIKFNGIAADEDPTEFKPYLYPMPALLDEIEEGGLVSTSLVKMWLELHGYEDDEEIDDIERIFNGFNIYYTLNGKEEIVQIHLDGATSSIEKIEWLLAHRFDVHGLIEKGMAYDATKHKVYSSVFIEEKDDDTYASEKDMFPDDYELCLLSLPDKQSFYFIKKPGDAATSYLIAVKNETEPTILLNMDGDRVLPEGELVAIGNNDRLRRAFSEMLEKGCLIWDFETKCLYKDKHRLNTGDKVYFPWFNPQTGSFVTIDGRFNERYNIMYCATWAEANKRTDELNETIAELVKGYKDRYDTEYARTLIYSAEE